MRHEDLWVFMVVSPELKLLKHGPSMMLNQHSRPSSIALPMASQNIYQKGRREAKGSRQPLFCYTNTSDVVIIPPVR